MIELLISDRLKGSLPQGPLNYVLTQEGEGWFTSEKIASLADVFVNNRAAFVGQKPNDRKMARVATTGASEGTSASQGPQGTHRGNFHPGRGGLGGPPLTEQDESGEVLWWAWSCSQGMPVQQGWKPWRSPRRVARWLQRISSR